MKLLRRLIRSLHMEWALDLYELALFLYHSHHFIKAAVRLIAEMCRWLC